MGKLTLVNKKENEIKENKPLADITFIKRPILENEKVTGIEYVALFCYFNNDMGIKEELPFKFKVDLTNDAKLNVDYDVFSIDSLYKTIEFQLPKILDKETFSEIKKYDIRKIPVINRIGFANRM